MNTCPITYEACEGRYSFRGLKKLSRSLTTLEDLPFSAADQIHEAAARAHKMSIQGVQPKLSAILNTRKKGFELVDTGGRFILKPQNPLYPHLPENEDLSMRLAAAAGIAAPLHGLVYAKDGSMTYFIKRFDRTGKRKIAVEDFSQLLGLSRDTKYDASMEKIVRVLEQHCTFPVLEKIKLLKLTLVNFLIGNEDMHAKNFSLISQDGKIELSPAYDILNTTIVLPNAQEEIALPVRGKKSKLNGEVLIDYFGRERLGLNPKVISAVISDLEKARPVWNELISISFLPNSLTTKYNELVEQRWAQLRN